MEQLIREEIRQYLVVSNSKSLTGLRTSNVDVIASKVDGKVVKDLVSKKAYYTSKLWKLLNSAAPVGVETPTDVLDPTVITNRFLAEKYLQSIIASGKEDFITVIKDHFNFQKAAKVDRENAANKDDFDLKLLRECEDMERRSLRVLQKHKVPFFVLNPAYTYPQLGEDQIWMLEKIVEMCNM